MSPIGLFRFDASAEIGGGHAMRCLTLARSMASAGWDCQFAWRDQTLETVPVLAKDEFASVRFDGPDSCEVEQLAVAHVDGVDLLVVDHYGRGKDFESACRGWAQHIAVVDDIPNRPHDCDILIDQTLGRRPRDYQHLVPVDCQILTGIEFAMLRPDFAAARPEALERRTQSRPISKILISFGMSDPQNLSAMALGAIADSGIEVAVDVVLGADAPHRASVETAHAALARGGAIYSFVDNMADLMVGADLAIGGAGSTAWERCCLGLPTLMFVLADNQRDIADALARIGAAENLGNVDHQAGARLSKRLDALVTEQDLVKGMGVAAASLCDGQGSQRVSKAIASMVAGV